MPTLLLRLAGPLQSWGTDSRFEIRRTEKMPTKSGVIGMIASALGRSREENIFDLNELQFGVRIDQPGIIITDFHTAKAKKDSYLTQRYYLSDAVFLVGLYSENSKKLNEIQAALASPAFPLFLGRRSCVPDPDMGLEIVHENLIQSLENAAYVGNKKIESQKVFPIYVEGTSIDRKNAFRLRDQPQTFNPLHRKYKDRVVYRIHSKGTEDVEEHDAFGEVDKL